MTASTPEVPDGEDLTTPGRGSTGRRARLLAGTVSVLVVAGIFGIAIPRIADYGRVWNDVNDLSTAVVIGLVAVALLNLLTFAPPWMAALPGLGYGRATVLTQASTALSNVVPGGDAIGVATSYAMLRGWGFPRRAIALAAVLFSAWNQLVNVAIPVAALVALSLSGEHLALLDTAALIGGIVLVAVLALLVLALRGQRAARRVGDLFARFATPVFRLVRRPPPQGWGVGLARFRADALVLLRRRWAVLTVATLLGHLTVFLVLLAALRALGVSGAQVGVAEALAAWSLLRLITAVPITPGGIGVVELGLTGALVGFGGHRVPVVAAVLLYRLLTFVPPILLGAVCFAVWTRRRTGPEGRGTASAS